MPNCRRCSFSFSSLRTLLLLLAAVLGDVAVAARPLRGLAEPPTPGSGTEAAGPAALQPGGGGGRHDRSEAGAEVILAGFAAAVMVVIFCYIRVTRKQNDAGSGSVGPDAKQQRLGGF